jgi:hypothetical protein
MRDSVFAAAACCVLLVLVLLSEANVWLWGAVCTHQEWHAVTAEAVAVREGAAELGCS